MTFNDEVIARIKANAANDALRQGAQRFLEASIGAGYSYNFAWMGRPIIQYPQDIVAMHELIWATRPDLVIETGIAHGGSLVMSASTLALLDYADAIQAGTTLDPRAPRRRVIGIDIDIRSHNRVAIEAHAMHNRIDMIQGSSVAPDMVAKVHELARGYRRILVCLDSNHTHDHVLAELQAYAPLTTTGSYCCVFDTMIEDVPNDSYPDRPWGVGNNPKTAVKEYLLHLEQHPAIATDGRALKFECDRSIQDKLMVTVAPDGYLKRVDT